MKILLCSFNDSEKQKPGGYPASPKEGGEGRICFYETRGLDLSSTVLISAVQKPSSQMFKHRGSFS
jgi:hypothetical protein